MKKLFAALLVGMFAMSAATGVIAADKKEDAKKKEEKKK